MSGSLPSLPIRSCSAQRTVVVVPAVVALVVTVARVVVVASVAAVVVVGGAEVDAVVPAGGDVAAVVLPSVVVVPSKLVVPSAVVVAGAVVVAERGKTSSVKSFVGLYRTPAKKSKLIKNAVYSSRRNLCDSGLSGRIQAEKSNYNVLSFYRDQRNDR